MALCKVGVQLHPQNTTIDELRTAAVRDRSGHEERGVPFEPFLAAIEEENRTRAVQGVSLESLTAASADAS